VVVLTFGSLEIFCGVFLILLLGTYGRSFLDFVQVILAVCGIVSWKKKIEVE